MPPYIAARSRIPAIPRPTGVSRWRPSWRSVVEDLELERGVGPADDHLGRRAAGVLEHVRERLLDDPVGGDRDAAGNDARLSLDGQLDGEAPAWRTCSIRVGISVTPGCGDSGASPSRSASRPSMCRSSSSAERPLDSTDSSSARERCSSRLMISRAAPVWSTITLTEWVTRSCSSRAILARSARQRRLLFPFEAVGPVGRCFGPQLAPAQRAAGQPHETQQHERQQPASDRERAG